MLFKLKVSFLTYWHSGTGLGDGGGADSSALTDRFGIPYYPGKALRGVLRNAMEKAQHLGWLNELDDNLIVRLFGTSHLNENQNRLTQSGNLFISNAELPQEERSVLSLPKNNAMKSALFTALASTAIDGQTGTVKQSSLRIVEVVVPLDLVAELELGDDLNEQEKQHTIQAIKLSLPLIEYIGAKRTRGLGKVAITMEVDNAG